jgi:hypothetical protein
MTRERNSHQSLWLIGLVTVVYGALLVTGASCTLAHDDRSESQRHHHGAQESSTQNVLCAWACQTTADTTVAIGSPSSVAAPVVGQSHLVSDPQRCSPSSSAAHSRAPPAISFDGLG